MHFIPPYVHSSLAPVAQCLQRNVLAKNHSMYLHGRAAGVPASFLQEEKGMAQQVNALTTEPLD